MCALIVRRTHQPAANSGRHVGKLYMLTFQAATAIQPASPHPSLSCGYMAHSVFCL